MAELIDLNINIGANTTDFQSSLIKAENLLKQFESALKKATNVGEINYLNTQIKNLNGTINGIKTQMQGVAKPTSDATNALSNLSRVAQDAPYGFIGIANNLNPLLESFQRLKEQSGSSTTALKAMVAGLTGPAGIGLALGVVSSLAVTYSKEISEFFKGPEAELKKFREELNKLNEDINKIVGGANANQAVALNLTSVIVGGNEQEASNALKILQETYSKSAELKKAKIGQDQQYYINLVNLAANQEKAIGREKLNEQELNLLYTKREEILKKRNAALEKAEKLEGIIGFPKAARVSAEKMRIGLTYGPELEQLDADIVKARIKNIDLVRALSEFETPDTKTKPSPIVNYAREENKALTLELAKMKALKDRMKEIGLEPIDTFKTKAETTAEEDKRKSYFDKQRKDLLELSNKSGFGAKMEGIFKKDKSKQIEEDAEKKRIEDLTKSYVNFADTISGSVTNSLMGMYEAIQAGQSPLEAIGDMFANIAKQIAAAVLQAVIFQALLEAFPALKGAFAAAGALSSAFGAARNLAPTNLGQTKPSTFNANGMNNSVSSNGQFVLRGQDLVLAMQRSNSSLNIIRG